MTLVEFLEMAEENLGSIHEDFTPENVAFHIKAAGYRVVKVTDEFWCEECDVEEPSDCIHEAENQGDPVSGPWFIRGELT